MNREFRLVYGLLALLVLAACSDRGSVELGHGQGTTSDTVDFGIAYIKHVLPTDPAELEVMRNKDDLRHYRRYWSKADVYLRKQAEESGQEVNITARVTKTDFYDVKDLDVSADGKFLVFAMRGPLQPNQREFNPPNWRIWEYDIAKDDLHSITDDVTASEGQDISPHYLPSDSVHPNGRILISSTRQRDSKLVLLTEGKSGFEAQTEDVRESAFTLSVLDPTQTGPSAFKQVSFNPSHDINPTVLSDGRILYTRWSHTRSQVTNGLHLYTVYPDGTNDQLLFGAHSHFIGTADPATGLPTAVQYVKAREMQDGHVMAVIRQANSGTDFGGNLVILDVQTSVECFQRTLAAGPLPPGTATPCPPLTPATTNDVRTIPGPSPGGRFNSAYPLWDGTGRILVSWEQCRLLNSSGVIVACTDDNLATPNVQIAPPLYSAWLLNPSDNTFKPVVPPTEGLMLTDIVTLQARTPPAYIPAIGTSTLTGDAVGIIDIRSVYDWADAINPQAISPETNAQTIARMSITPANSRRVRFMRFEKIVSLGDERLNDGFPDFNRNVALDNSPGYMREILGYVPIEADGSVRVKVPANVAFNISILDARGHRLSGFPQHRTWLQVRPGEVIQCNGCHNASTATSTTSHGRDGVFVAENAGDASGRTMAQVTYGANTNCASTPCNAATPTVDVIYNGTGSPGDSSVNLAYSKLTTPAPTVPQTCENNWTAVCRITINYAASAPGAANTSPAIIDPLWTVDRGAHTCINCHTATRTTPVTCTPAGTSTPITVNLNVAAAGGLELDDAGAVATAQLPSYVQLVATHTTSSFSLDAACAPVRTDSQVPGSITNGSAAASQFFKVMTGNSVGTVNHKTYMSPSELRLLAEWADVGAQYYNNPFAAPLN
ncbi:MAG TPA: hypothetical protein VGN77_00645 [Steroidobacteraceae bacterium]|nr:hypothetical protein [Steroidobacteraceae bacterium]